MQLFQLYSIVIFQCIFLFKIVFVGGGHRVVGVVILAGLFRRGFVLFLVRLLGSLLVWIEIIGGILVSSTKN